jgi:hypothetical protein
MSNMKEVYEYFQSENRVYLKYRTFAKAVSSFL